MRKSPRAEASQHRNYKDTLQSQFLATEVSVATTFPFMDQYVATNVNIMTHVGARCIFYPS